MVISYFGVGMVKVQLGDTVIVFNPIGESAEHKAVKFGSDVALVSLLDPAWNGVENAARGDRQPFIVNGPGEYEVNGIFIKGLLSTGPEGKVNTVYTVLFDDIRLVHLGALVDNNLSEQVIESLGSVDILFAPVALPKLATQLEPNVIIPINWSDDKALNQFLKQVGEGNEKAAESLTIKRKDLADKAGVVMVVKSY
jgi:hypothetical protein